MIILHSRESVPDACVLLTQFALLWCVWGDWRCRVGESRMWVFLFNKCFQKLIGYWKASMQNPQMSLNQSLPPHWPESVKTVVWRQLDWRVVDSLFYNLHFTCYSIQMKNTKKRDNSQIPVCTTHTCVKCTTTFVHETRETTWHIPVSIMRIH